MDVSMGQDSQENSQENSQKTQPLSQPDGVRPEDDLRAECWGLLIPCTPEKEPVRFLNSTPKITVGRHPHSTLRLTWMALSSLHAVIMWNGQDDGDSTVTIEDHSSNGTYLKGERIGKGKSRVLNDGCEISFGPVRSGENHNKPEYRYTYRDLVSEKRELYRRYDLSTELGQGSYARVYKALQKGTSKWVAVKVINQTMRFNLTPAREADAIREITVMRTLRHPNICAFLDYFENRTRALVRSFHIVLEYMPGGNLGTYMMQTNKGRGISEWMSCHFTYQICKAVTYIHTCKITHRDLKPENILLTLDQPPIIKIADFGLANFDDVTALRTICGTRSYMAPEIITRLSTDNPYTNSVDSWSVGAIVFSMFTMKTPFPKLPTLEVKNLVSNQLIDWVHLDETERITDSGKDFVRKLLVFEPALRMSLPSAQEHPWLVGHKPTYEIQNPDELDASEPLTRTASLNSGAGNSTPHRPFVPRAVTIDPYADDYQPIDNLRTPPPDPGYSRAATVDPYADDYPAPVQNLRVPPDPPSLLDSIAEISAKVPGLSLAPRRDTPTESAQRALDPNYAGYRRDSTYELYAPAAVPEIQPGPAAPERGAQKRTFAEMHRDGSSPLTSVSSSPEPPPRKKSNKKKVPKKSNGDGPKPDAPRKARAKKDETQETAPTVLRRSNRPARLVKR
ncbi:kinase-like domain-containing protein [Mycena galopus ATCC 62051]|nr:kinase-like domain-containing protein [Mycena galopus ATCC 62051]